MNLKMTRAILATEISNRVRATRMDICGRGHHQATIPLGDNGVSVSDCHSKRLISNSFPRGWARRQHSTDWVATTDWTDWTASTDWSTTIVSTASTDWSTTIISTASTDWSTTIISTASTDWSATTDSTA